MEYLNSNNGFNERVLILNQSYEPLTTCSTRKALILLFLTKADLIEDNKNRQIRTISNFYPFPSVIKLNSYKRVPRKHLELSRKNIFQRDNYSCQYCGSKELSLTIDHIIPKSRGGVDSWENLTTACFKCNNAKGNMTLQEVGFRMTSKPMKPNYIMFLNKSINKMEDSWKQFLFY